MAGLPLKYPMPLPMLARGQCLRPLQSLFRSARRFASLDASTTEAITFDASRSNLGKQVALADTTTNSTNEAIEPVALYGWRMYGQNNPTRDHSSLKRVPDDPFANPYDQPAEVLARYRTPLMKRKASTTSDTPENRTRRKVQPAGRRSQSATQKDGRREDEQFGRVVSAGDMPKTVRVTQAGQRWNSYLRKYYKSRITHLVHDPASSLRAGDIITFASLPRPRTARVRSVVTSIRVPFGSEISARPPVPPAEEVTRAAAEKVVGARYRRRMRARAARGDAAARKVVRATGIAVRVVRLGSGRGQTKKTVLLRDFRAGLGAREGGVNAMPKAPKGKRR